jgi:hypothetical protein
MSAPSSTAGASPWQRLPPRLRPRETELPGAGNTRLIETTVLLLVGLFLLIATVNDLVRETHVNDRLIADLKTWRHYTGHDYHNLSISPELLGTPASEREVVCGNTTPGAPKTRTQLCLAIWGPDSGGRRTIHGGWYLRANVQDDVRAERYGCFGAASEGRCPP